MRGLGTTLLKPESQTRCKHYQAGILILRLGPGLWQKPHNKVRRLAAAVSALLLDGRWRKPILATYGGWQVVIWLLEET